jgi:predicted nucleic acid-binding protein
VIVVSNTTPIIAFAKINRLEILEYLFGRIYISEGVYKELISNKKFIFEIEQITKSSFIIVKEVKNRLAVELIQKMHGLNMGESESIILFKELGGDLLIMDEKKGRKVASSLDIELTGTLGILLKAKQEGIIIELKPILEKLIESNIRISHELYKEILKSANEMF